MRSGSVVVLAVFAAGTASAGEVFFTAPAELRPAIVEEIQRLNHAATDVSAIDDALFNGADSVKARIARGALKFEPPAALPEPMKADLKVGLAACRARGKSAATDCGAELAQTVWQRHLERTRPLRVLEFRKPEKWKTGIQFECATYKPGEATVSVLRPHGEGLDRLVRKATVAMLTRELAANGGRPNSSVLPGELPPPMADLTQGVMQSLAPLKVPAGCEVEGLKVMPQNAPLARTMEALWASSRKGHEATGERECTLMLDGPQGERATSLTFHCGSSLLSQEIFAGSAFGSGSFQADMARAFLQIEINDSCVKSMRK